MEDNPVSALEIKVADGPRPESAFVVGYEDRYYAVADGPYGELRRHAFELIYQLFQLTVARVRAALVPPVTISK